ncbi:MAG: hypothetical protein WAX80_00515 [Minisyncoccia bacterium]
MDQLAQVWQPLVGPGVCSGPDCTFGSLIILLKNLITDLVIISTLLAAMAFAYAGIVLLTSGGSEAKKETAKGILWKVLIGYLWILFAWIIVYTITSTLLKPEFFLLKP